MGRTYICDCCGEVNTTEWSEADALAEKERNFGDMPLEEMNCVCTTYYKKIMAFNNHEIK